MDARVGQPDGSTKLCLSCHDGTVALDDAGGMGSGLRAGGAHLGPGDRGWLGTDLTDDHPVSFAYDDALATADGALAAPSTERSGLGGTIADDLLDGASRVQCTTCHDPHDDSLGDFLRVPNARGALCTTCHTRADYALSAHAPDVAPSLARGCATCHASHGGAGQVDLLVASERALCGRCHADQVPAQAPAGQGAHGRTASAGANGTAPVRCATCHDPHGVRAAGLATRAILTDPDDPMRPRAAVPEPQTPWAYTRDPARAAASSADFCLDCHDGTWPGATDVRAELVSVATRTTDFALDGQLTNLHAAHARGLARERGVGCTYCHDVHGASGGNRGVPRDALLQPWLDVREFPYRGPRSCATTDALGKCHGPGVGPP